MCILCLPPTALLPKARLSCGFIVTRSLASGTLQGLGRHLQQRHHDRSDFNFVQSFRGQKC